MLNINWITNNIIEVEEIIFGFIKDTSGKYVYYDIKNNRKYMHPQGKKSSTFIWQDMTTREIEWVKKYYLPKLNAFSKQE